LELGRFADEAFNDVVVVVVVVVASIDSTTASSKLFVVVDEALEDFRDFFFVDEALEQLFRLPLRRGGSGEATCSASTIPVVEEDLDKFFPFAIFTIDIVSGFYVTEAVEEFPL